MSSRIPPNEMCAVFKAALKRGVVKEDDTAGIFYDLSRITQRIRDLKEAFPALTLHAIAIKANPVRKILRIITKDSTIGLEASSLPELVLAHKLGLAPETIVFDSPVKTFAELELALRLGCHINADNFSELERISALRGRIKTKSSVGIRINPQVGVGRIASTSLAGEYSKFGVPLKLRRGDLARLFAEYDWLKGVHLHVGSQGCGADLIIEGIRAVYDFVSEVNAGQARPLITIFDIGGGLPVSYCQDENALNMTEYARRIEAACPDLFSSGLKIITEFGRYVHANAGWVASRVEYVKNEANARTLMIHVGADLFLRKCLNPNDWHHDLTLISKNGEIKTGKLVEYVVAGPLCFSGDIIERRARLPKADDGDYVLISDAGAYTLSTWSRLVSRQTPKVIGYYGRGDGFKILKPKESVNEVLKFWGL